jgi:hypothetical protein
MFKVFIIYIYIYIYNIDIFLVIIIIIKKFNHGFLIWIFFHTPRKKNGEKIRNYFWGFFGGHHEHS